MSNQAPKATAAALDMCVDFGIDPAAIPNPEKVTLTQPMVQAYKDALPEASGEASGEAPVIALRPEWASDDRPAIQAYAKALGIPANGRTETLVAAIESAIEAGTARLLTAEELDKYADPASAGGEEA